MSPILFSKLPRIVSTVFLETRSRNKFAVRNYAGGSGPIFCFKEVRRFMTDCLVACGAKKELAAQQADLLAEADYRGHYSHGMNRLGLYVKELKKGICNGKVMPKILKETAGTAHVDGQNGLGAVVGNFCMDVCIKKAQKTGVGLVACKGSNHYGMAAMFPLRAVKLGLIGFSCTNTSPLMVPTRAKESALGTNPISLAAPGVGKDTFVLDMATSAVARGKLEMQKRKGQPLPDGWAMNASGTTENDATKALAVCRLFPLGGPEVNSGYKGTGLAVLVEVLSGILGGANYGPHLRKFNEPEKVANIGHCFFAADPNCFASGFRERLTDLTTHLRKMTPADPKKPVLVAGDPEKAAMARHDKQGGVIYVKNQLKTCAELAKQLKVKPLTPK